MLNMCYMIGLCSLLCGIQTRDTVHFLTSKVSFLYVESYVEIKQIKNI